MLVKALVQFSLAEDPQRWSTWGMQLLDKIWVEHALARHGAVNTIFCLFGLTSFVNQPCVLFSLSTFNGFVVYYSY